MNWQINETEATGLDMPPKNLCAASAHITSSATNPMEAVSPSLQPAATGIRGAYELKFLLTSELANAVLTEARRVLSPDPHGDPHLGGGYLVNSVYTDTPAFDVYFRSPRFRRRKLRLRRYGSDSLIWLESKRKRQGLVQKRRFPVHAADLTDYFLGQPADVAQDWFRIRLERQQLLPVCQLTYRRQAFVGQTAGSTMRLTIDRQLRAGLADGWSVPAALLSGPELLEDSSILELKFRGALPAAFRNLVNDLQLQPTGFSKYRTSVEATMPWERLGNGSTEDRSHA